MTLFSQYPDFQCAGNVHHIQYKQSCIQVPTLDPIFLAVVLKNLNLDFYHFTVLLYITKPSTIGDLYATNLKVKVQIHIN